MFSRTKIEKSDKSYIKVSRNVKKTIDEMMELRNYSQNNPAVEFLINRYFEILENATKVTSREVKKQLFHP